MVPSVNVVRENDTGQILMMDGSMKGPTAHYLKRPTTPYFD